MNLEKVCITNHEFLDMLEKLDWFSCFSDSPEVYHSGHDQIHKVKGIAEQDDELKSLFESFKAHVFSGGAWETPKVPKPELPQDVIIYEVDVPRSFKFS